MGGGRHLSAVSYAYLTCCATNNYALSAGQERHAEYFACGLEVFAKDRMTRGGGRVVGIRLFPKSRYIALALAMGR